MFILNIATAIVIFLSGFAHASNLSTWEGDNSNIWLDPLNWDSNTLPALNADILIPHNNNLGIICNIVDEYKYNKITIERPDAENSKLYIGGNTLSSDKIYSLSSNTIINKGSIFVEKNGNLYAADKILNERSIHNRNTIQTQQLDNSWYISNYFDGKISINAGGMINNYGDIENDGSINEPGTANTHIFNYDYIRNEGKIYISTIQNDSMAEIQNYDYLEADVMINSGHIFEHKDAIFNVNHFSNDFGGTFKGSGNIEIDTFINKGTLDVFYPLPSQHGLTILGDFEQTDTGNINLNFGSSSDITNSLYNFVKVEGTALLDGILNIFVYEKFNIENGQTFDVFKASLLQGSFSSILGSSGWNFSAEYLDPDASPDGLYTVRLTARAVPIPGAAMLLGGGLLGLIGLRRKFA